MRGVAVRSYLTDDELLLAIASNTNSFSALIEKQFELDAGVGAPDPNTRRNLMRFNVQTINNYHRECFAAAIPRFSQIARQQIDRPN